MSAKPRGGGDAAPEKVIFSVEREGRTSTTCVEQGRVKVTAVARPRRSAIVRSGHCGVVGRRGRPLVVRRGQ